MAYYREVVENCPIPVIVIHQTFARRPFAATPEQIGDICSMENVFGYITEGNIRISNREPDNSCRLTKNSGYATAAYFSTER